MAELTANERAATFIGWKRDALCALRDNDGYCAVHNVVSEFVAHPIPAPDMTDPRNYMRALEAQTGRMYVIKFYEGSCDDGDPWVTEFVPWKGAVDRYPAEGQSVTSIGDATMKALAALYDAEHATSSGDPSAGETS